MIFNFSSSLSLSMTVSLPRAADQEWLRSALGLNWCQLAQNFRSVVAVDYVPGLAGALGKLLCSFNLLEPKSIAWEIEVCGGFLLSDQHHGQRPSRRTSVPAALGAARS